MFARVIAKCLKGSLCG